MFRFEQPEYLYFLFLLLPVAGGLLLDYSMRRRSLRRVAEPVLLPALLPGYSIGKRRVKGLLFLLGLAFLIVGWANPQRGVEQRPARRAAADVYIALDVSRSMLAEDIAPSRLDRAKRLARDLVRAIRTERIATLLFAGYAFIQTPLTSDFAQVDLLLRSARPELIDYQGTAITEAIELAVQLAPEESAGSSALVIFTDGEDHQEGWQEQARRARERGFTIYTVGLGGKEGAPIPQGSGGRGDFLRDKNGKLVRSSLDEGTLRELAALGGGRYFSARTRSSRLISELKEALDQLQKQEFDQPVYSEYRSYFQYFIGLALFCFLLESVLGLRKGQL